MTDPWWKTSEYPSERTREAALIFSLNLLNLGSRILPGSFSSCLQLPARRCCQGSEAYEPAPSSIVTSEVRPIPLIFDADSFSTPAAAWAEYSASVIPTLLFAGAFWARRWFITSGNRHRSAENLIPFVLSGEPLMLQFKLWNLLAHLKDFFPPPQHSSNPVWAWQCNSDVK